MKKLIVLSFFIFFKNDILASKVKTSVYRTNIVNLKEFIRIDLNENSKNSHFLLPHNKILNSKPSKTLNKNDIICDFANILKISVILAKLTSYKIGDQIRKIDKEDIKYLKTLYKSNTNAKFPFEDHNFINKLQSNGYILYEPMRHKRRFSKYYKLLKIIDVFSVNNNYLKRPDDPQIIITRDLNSYEYYIAFRGAYPKENKKKNISNLLLVMKILDPGKKYKKKNSPKIENINNMQNIKLNKFAYEGIVKPKIKDILKIINKDIKKCSFKNEEVKIFFLGQSLGGIAAQIACLCFCNSLIVQKNEKLNSSKLNLNCYITSSPRAMDRNGYKILEDHNIFVNNIISGKEKKNKIEVDPFPFFKIDNLTRASNEIIITKKNIWLLKPNNTILLRKENLLYFLKAKSLHILINLKTRLSKILHKIGYCDINV